MSKMVAVAKYVRDSNFCKIFGHRLHFDNCIRIMGKRSDSGIDCYVGRAFAGLFD